MKYEFTKDKPDAIFCTHVSNVTGYILPVKKYLRRQKIWKYYSFRCSAIYGTCSDTSRFNASGFDSFCRT